MKTQDIRFIDLFAGIGGFHIGMHSVGGKCVFASEIDKFARYTYETNFKQFSPELFQNGFFNEDITDPNLDYSKIPAFDILCAGFPCQPFSHAGLKKGFTDTRGTLFFNIEEIIRTKIEQGLPPKVLFLENVKGLKSHDKGRTFRIIKENLEKLGYSVKAEILNSKHFGIPQNRERIFIIAWYKDLVKADDFRFPYGIDGNGAVIYEKEKREELCAKVRVGDILLNREHLNELEQKEGRSCTISAKLWEGHQRRRIEHAQKGNGFGYSIFDENSAYTSTISARYYKDGSEILINQKHLNERPRKLHPLEAAALQGYPVKAQNGDFIFEIPVSGVQAYKQFGNSVTVSVIKAIANEIKKQLL